MFTQSTRTPRCGISTPMLMLSGALIVLIGATALKADNSLRRHRGLGHGGYIDNTVRRHHGAGNGGYCGNSVRQYHGLGERGHCRSGAFFGQAHRSEVIIYVPAYSTVRRRYRNDYGYPGYVDVGDEYGEILYGFDKPIDIYQQHVFPNLPIIPDATVPWREGFLDETPSSSPPEVTPERNQFDYEFDSPASEQDLPKPRIDDLPEGWDLIARRRPRAAMWAFVDMLKSRPDDQLARLGVAISAGLISEHDRSRKAMRTAIVQDAEILNRLPQDHRIIHATKQVLGRYRNRARSRLDSPQTRFMVAAMLSLTDEDARAELAIKDAIARGDANPAAKMLLTKVTADETTASDIALAEE